MSDLPSGEEASIYAVRISPAAADQAADAYDRLTETFGIQAAEDWREGLQSAWTGLATYPMRCSIAPEDSLFQKFSPGPPLRVFLHRGKGRRSAWRLLFTAHPETAGDPPTVRVHLIPPQRASPSI